MSLGLGCADGATGPNPPPPPTIGPAFKLVFVTQPLGALGGTAFTTQPVVEIQDSAGRRTADNISITVRLGVNSTAGTLSGSATVNAAQGRATFTDLAIDRIGDYTLVAESPTLRSATSALVTVAVGQARQLVFLQQPDSAIPNVALRRQPVVELRDAGGNRATGATQWVRMSIWLGPLQGRLLGTDSAQAQLGVATFTSLRVDRVGQYQLLAKGPGLDSAFASAFTAAIGPAAAVHFVTEPAGARGGEAFDTQPAVEIVDVGGNRAASTAAVTLTLSGAGATLSGTATRAAAAGLASFTGLAVDRAGSGYSLLAASTGLASDTSAVFAVTTGAAQRLVFTVQPAGASGGAVFTPQLQVVFVDAGGNVNVTRTDTVRLALGANPTGDTLRGWVASAATQGRAYFDGVWVNRAGSGYTMVASVPGFASVESTPFDVTVGPAIALRFAVAPPDSGRAGDPLTPSPQVEIVDRGGNRVTTSTHDITMAIGSASPNPATLSGAKTVAATGGLAAFPDLSIDLVGSYHLQASASLPGGGAAVDQYPGATNIRAAAPAALVFTTNPAGGAGGEWFDSVTTIGMRDRFGNFSWSPSVPITVALGANPGGGTLQGTLTRNGVIGLQFYDLAIDKAAAGYTLVASAPGLTGASSLPFAIRVGAPAMLRFAAQPGSGTGGLPLATQPVVDIVDRGGNRIGSSSADTIHLAIVAPQARPGAALLGAVAARTDSGRARFTGIAIDSAFDRYRIAATATITTAIGPTPFAVISDSFSVAVGPPAAVGFSREPVGAAEGVPFGTQPMVQLRDAGGNVIRTNTPTVSVAILANPGVGSLAGTPSVAPLSGTATFSGLSIDKAGTGYTLIAAAPGFAPDTSAPFDVVLGVPHHLAFTTQPVGGLQGEALAVQPVVTILDAGGYPVLSAATNVSLAFGANPAAGVLSGTSSVAPVRGVAAFSGLSIDSAARGYTLVASAGGLSFVTSDSVGVRIKFAQMAAGNPTACGLDVSGRAYCWGDNTFGQFGNGQLGASAGDSVPRPVNQGALAFTQLAQGGGYTCALTVSGAAYCWGDNSYGQLGNPAAVSGATTPLAVSGGRAYARISGHNGTTCAISASGKVYCWGRNGYGQVGNGGTADATAPDSVRLSPTLVMSSVSVGDWHACATADNGDIYCWGWGVNGQLGDNDTTDHVRTTPALVVGGLNAVSVVAGGTHSCALTTLQTASCWGRAWPGALGDGAALDVNREVGAPVAVTGGLLFSALAAGEAVTCGIATGGTAYCWGELFGTVPTVVNDGRSYGAITTWSRLACGVAADGAGYCWGWNPNGQVGDGTRTSRAAPTAVTAPKR